MTTSNKVVVGLLCLVCLAIGLGAGRFISPLSSVRMVAVPTPEPTAKPTARPKPTATPKPTPTPNAAQRRRARAEKRRREREEKARIKKENEEAARATKELARLEKEREGESEYGELAFQLATIDNGYVEKSARSVKRFKYLLERLSSNYKESAQQIADMTVKSKELLDEAGISESLENMMEGMNKVLPNQMLNNSGENMQSYAEYIALYVTSRREGTSHSEVISSMRLLTGS